MSETNNLAVIKNQLEKIGWIVKVKDNSLYLLQKYSKKRLLKLKDAALTKALTPDEVYAYSVLLVIEGYHFKFYEMNDQRHAYNKALNNDQIDYGFRVSLIECLTEAKTNITTMYYAGNWSILKPILQKVLDTTRKDSMVYSEVYEKMSETFNTLKP